MAINRENLSEEKYAKSMLLRAGLASGFMFERTAGGDLMISNGREKYFIPRGEFASDMQRSAVSVFAGLFRDNAIMADFEESFLADKKSAYDNLLSQIHEKVVTTKSFGRPMGLRTVTGGYNLLKDVVSSDMAAHFFKNTGLEADEIQDVMKAIVEDMDNITAELRSENEASLSEPTKN